MRALRTVVGLQLAVALLSAAAAAAPGPQGANTGDGSTPFTGLAQAPEANLFVGAATLAVPIELPPGRAGMTPTLALTYNSSVKQTPFGAGWDLPIGKIQRCLKHGVMSCTDTALRNEFVLELPSGTIECTLVAGGRCLPPVEDSFLRIDYQSAANTWLVVDRDGNRYTFGDLAGARTGSDVNSFFVPAVAASAGHAYAPCRFTFSWALTRIEDTNGNTVTIAYAKNKEVLYPLSIQYGGNAGAGVASMFEVALGWEDYSGRGPMSATGGFAAEIGKRLQFIDVRYAGGRVRRYDLTYSPLFTTDRETQALQDVMLSSGQGPLLNAANQPARTTFLYRRDVADPLTTGFGPPQRLPAFSIDQPSRLRIENQTLTVNGVVRDVFDMNADGFVDLINMHGCSDPWDVYLGSRSGFATTPIRWSVPECMFIRLTDVAGRADVPAQAFDIDGDAVPDYVDGLHACTGFDCDYSYWRVYRGRVGVGANGWGFESTPIHWPKPVELDDIYLRKTAVYVGAVAGWPTPTVSHRDLIDMNADGLVDLVSAETETWKVWFNTGAGFTATSVDFEAPYPFLRLSSAPGDEMIGLYDINGDALPDQVVACDKEQHQDCPRGPLGGPLWKVHLNTGYGLAAVPDLWSFGTVPLNAGIRRVQSQRVVRDLFDIDGDGLPDVVETRADNNWNVYLNSGFDFRLEPMLWKAGSNRIRDANTFGLTEKDTFDFDGDGLVDFVDFDPASNDSPTAVAVRRNSMGAWCASTDGTTCAGNAGGTGVARNADAGAAGLLVQVENGIGGTTHLEYRPSTEWDNTDTSGIPRLPLPLWTLSAIDSDDGLCDAAGAQCVGVAGAAHSVRTEFRYGHGVYDHRAREFRGFGTVEQRDAAGNLTTTHFHQDRGRQGRVNVVERFAADPVDEYDKPIDQVVQFWQCVNADTGADMGCDDEPPSARLWVRQTGDQVVTYSNFSLDGAQWRATTRFDWQRCAGEHTGNARFGGALSSDGAMITTLTDYACAPQRHLLDKPTHTYMHGADGIVLEEKWFLYDADAAGNPLALGNVDRGLVTATDSWIDATSSLIQSQPCVGQSNKSCIRERRRYDAFGNTTQIVDANNHATQIVYDPATHFLYPSTTTNAAGHIVGTQYDVGCGKLLSQTLPYRQQAPTTAKVRRRYDSFCRLERTANADENLDTSPHEIFVYQLGAVRQPTVMKVFTVEPYFSQTATPGSIGSAVLPHSHYLPVTTMTDAMGRAIQRVKRSVVDGQLTGVAAVTIGYDDRGRIARQFAPFAVSAADHFTTPSTAAGFEQFAYDAVGRVVLHINPDGGMRRLDHLIAWQTTTEDECYADTSCVGGRSVELRDAVGRVVERQVYAQSNGGGESLAAKTRYAYDALGRLIRSVQWNGNAWAAATTIEHSYDSLGRRMLLDDPDSGVWTYGYDAAGNLRWQDDPKPGQHVQFCYDAVDRITKKYVFTNVDFPQAFATCGFDATVEYEYDSPSDPYGIGQLSVVEDPSGSTWFNHDERGRVTSVNKAVAVLHDPPMQTSPAHWAQFLYTFDVADHIASIRYPDGEIVAHRYDAAGQLNRLESDNGKVYLSAMTYDAFGRRRRISHGDGTVDERTYYTDKTKGFRLSSISTAQGNTKLLDLSYSGYTRTGLITRIDDRANPGAADPLSSTVSYEYDGIGRLVRATGNNLSAAPNDRYAYDLLGNIILKEGRSFTYDAARPHQLTRIDGNPSGIAHDQNGSRIGKPGQSYGYDAEGRLESIGGTAVDIQYDYSGRQVAKYVAATAEETRYFNELAESRNGTLVKYYFAGDLRIATRENTAWQFAAVDRPASGTFLASRGVEWLSTAAFSLRSPAITLIAVLAVLLIPGGRRRGLGFTVKPGHVLLAIALWLSGTLPPLARPALAGGGGGYCAGCSVVSESHYHSDHLGSTLLVSRSAAVVEQIRYKPFGSVRLRSSGTGAPVSLGVHPYEFTGYQTDTTSGLQYAGARFYDPDLALFVSHDPQRQFPSPYAYGSWNPVNGIDPDGEFFFLIPILAVALEAFTAVLSAVQAALSALITQLQPIVAAAAKGAVNGVAGSLFKGSVQAISTRDADAFLESIKEGAINGAVSGAIIDGTALGGALEEVAGPQLGLSDLLTPSTDLIAKGGEAAVRGAFAGAVRGAVGSAATTIAEGGNLGSGIVAGLREGSIRGAFSNVLQPSVDAIAQSTVGPLNGHVAAVLGVAGPNTDTSLATMLRGGLLRSTAGAALGGAHKGVGDFLGRGLGRLGRFEAADLANGAASAAKSQLKGFANDQIKRLTDHHVQAIAESPQVHR